MGSLTWTLLLFYSSYKQLEFGCRDILFVLIETEKTLH